MTRPETVGMPEIDHCLLTSALTGLASECGDAGLVAQRGRECFLALLDVLGHGREAHEVAVRAQRYLGDALAGEPVQIMTDLHGFLAGTRGAVAALCLLNLDSGDLRYVGVGNITTRIYGRDPAILVPKDGILGYSRASPIEKRARLAPGDILLMYSDGLKEHFHPEEHPGLLSGSARQIAERMMARLAKGNDDASCLVARYGR